MEELEKFSKLLYELEKLQFKDSKIQKRVDSVVDELNEVWNVLYENIKEIN